MAALAPKPKATARAVSCCKPSVSWMSGEIMRRSFHVDDCVFAEADCVIGSMAVGGFCSRGLRRERGCGTRAGGRHLSCNGFCSSKVAIIWVLTTPHIKCRSTFATQMQCCGHGLDVLPASGF